MSDDEQDFLESSQAPELMGTGSTDVGKKISTAAIINREDRSAGIILGEAKPEEYDYRIAAMQQQVHMVSNVKEEELEGDELVRRKDVVDLIKNCYKDSDGEGPQPEDTAGKNFDRGWDAALSLIADRISGDLPPNVEKKNAKGDSN